MRRTFDVLMSYAPRPLCSILLASFFLFLHGLGTAAGVPPRGDELTRRQAVLDLRHPAVVMSISAEPGAEDLPALISLRQGEGARVVSVYVTDGAATPDDIDGSIPLLVGGRRRMEAESVMTAVGGEGYFLGFPDYGCVRRKEMLRDLWNRDSLLERISLAIRTYRPDVILCATDPRSASGDTTRSAVIRGAVLEAVNAAAGFRPDAPGLPGAWSVPRVFEEARSLEGAFLSGVNAVDPVLKKPYTMIGAGSARLYRSLRARIGQWNSRRKGAYSLLLGRGGEAHGLIDGLPVLPSSLGATAAAVEAAARDAGAGPEESALRSIAGALARVDNAVAARRAELTGLERRLLLRWEERLEDLRCAILGIGIRFALSDTVVTERQLFTLRFQGGRNFPAAGRSEIIFPFAMDSTWFINGSEGFRFAFAPADTFAMITPEHMTFDRPLATIGSARPSVHTRLQFVIVHKDPDPLRNFAYRSEMVIGVSPNQSAEIITPCVRITPGERLVVRLRNISRDPYRGSLWVRDSVAAESRKNVRILRSEGARFDTLRLNWADGPPDGNYVVDVHVGKGRAAVGSFTARKFTALADTDARVGLYTGLAGSPVEDALRRLHVRCRRIDGTSDVDSASGIRTIIVDRDALALRSDAGRVSESIAAWVRGGGHCVMLRQSPEDSKGNPLAGALWFAAGGVIAPDAPVAADTAAPILSAPNAISRNDWEGWIISRAQSPLVAPSGVNPAVQVRDASSGVPLVATVPLGKGTLTGVALDILPQLQIVHPGAYRLLANIVSH